MSRSLSFDVVAQDSASREFATIAAAAEKLEDRLKRLDRLRVEPSVQLNITPATRSAAQLQSRLEALRNVRVNVAVDGAAEARREVTGLVVEMRKLRNTRVRLDVDGNAATSVAALSRQLGTLRNARVRVDLDGNAASKLTALATSLRTLNRGAKVKVELDDGTFARDIARLHQRVSALRGTTVRIDFDIRPPGIREELNDIAAALVRLRGSTSHEVNVNADGARRSLNETILSFKLLAAAAASPIAIPGIFAATSSLLSLGGAAVSASGSLLLLPAAGLAGAAAMGTLALGMAHVSDALGPTGTPAQIKKVNEALAALSPNARAAVETIRGLGPAFSDMRLEVQTRLFMGVAEQIQSLSDTYMPVLKTGLGGISTELNRGATMWAEWANAGPAVADLTTILGNTEATMRALAPAGVNVAAALTDIGVVGSEILPELAGGATNATERFREFIAEARKSGELEGWIRGGLDTLGQLGQVAGNTGGILGGMFRAADAAGADFLGSTIRITGALDNLINSTRGQEQLTTVFRESQASVDAMLPGVQALAGGVLELLANFSTTQGLQQFGGLISQTAIAVQPLISYLGTLAGETLGALAGGATIAVGALSPIVGAVTGISSALGPVVPLVAAAVIAFKGLGLATASVVALGAAITGTAALTSTLVAGLTGSLAAGAAASAGMAGLGAAVGAVGRALPVVGVAAVALGFALNSMTIGADDAVAALNRGGASADQMRAALDAQTGVTERSRSGFNDWANSINAWVNTNVFGIESVESATAAQARQREGMTALQRAQQDVTTAQNAYQQALDKFPAGSAPVITAAANLATATDRVEQEQRAAADATKSHTDRMVEQADQALAAVNASMGYEGALLNLEGAQKRAADAVRDHGAGSYEARQAEFALQQQHFATAAAAGEKARADAEATGASNAAEIGARAQKDELIRLAGTLTGPAREALLGAARDMGDLSTAESIAEDRARTHKDELARLAGQASGQTASALSGLAGNFDTLGGATATARERALLQIQALEGIARTSSGTLRPEIQRMIDQIKTIPDGRFTVTADGRIGVLNSVGPGGTPIRWSGGGHTGGVVGASGPGGILQGVGFAGGGVLPGYTPGRDPHIFTSPTGGRIGLSGGEAVMRPEWTRAVGPAYVAQANAAARQGGIDGVKRFVTSRTERGVDSAHFARGGVVGRPDLGNFAVGGIVRTGTQPYVSGVHNVYNRLNEDVSARLTETVQARIKAIEAARAAAAAAAAGGPLGGGNGRGWQWQMSVLRQRFPGLALNSGYRPGAITATGNPSYHGQGRAVDVPPRMDVFNWIRGNYGGTAREIIFSPAGGSQIHNGRPHVYTGVTKSMHYDHVHWAQKRGGVLPSDLSRPPRKTSLADRGGLIPSGQAALNLSGRAERMLSPRQTEGFDQLVAAITGERVDLRSVMRDRPMPGMARPATLDTGPMVRELAAMRAEFGTVTAAVQSARPITVEDRSANPLETARAVQLALRMA
jgi:hypothetical protein